jgi:L-lactate dehydrogenase
MAELLDISEKSVNITVVGEHGSSAVALLSSVRIMGMTPEEYLKTVTNKDAEINVKLLNEKFKKDAYRILCGKGYTSTGVSATVCRVISAIASDSREILPVSSVLQGEYGITGVAVSVPSVVGRNGIEEIIETAMDEDERRGFLASADVIRNAAASEGMI